MPPPSRRRRAHRAARKSAPRPDVRAAARASFPGVTREHLRRLSDQLIAVQRPIRILKAINWGPQRPRPVLQERVHASCRAPSTRRSAST